MKADLSRDTFRRHDHFARVLMQQGRVLLEADWNEQVSIHLEQTRALAADLIGPHGGPGDGYLITCNEDHPCDVEIGWGRYYIDGIACDLAPEPMCPPATDVEPMRYSTQMHYPYPKGVDDPEELKAGEKYVVYLDIWERHLNALQADGIREVALGGPDTATRSQVVCQVKIADMCDCTPIDETLECDDLLDLLVGATLRLPRCLRARAKVEMPSEDPCLVSATSQFRGPENQLYRVEIHHHGTAGGAVAASFKWSRDNGSVVFGILSLQGAVAKLASLGRDQTCSLKAGDWVEIVDDTSELLARPRPLLKVLEVDPVEATVILTVPEGMTQPVFDATSTTHPLLRRWDQKSNVIQVQESRWIDLEDGVQVWFEQGGDYKIGDYWLIPARTAIGDVLWPTVPGPDGKPKPKAQPPNGIAHHIAPLRRIEVDAAGHVICGEDCRCVFPTLCELAHAEAPTDPGPTPPPQPTESTVALEPVDFVRGEDQMPETSGVIVERNSAILNDALSGNRLLRVMLNSLAPETGEGGQALGDRRATDLRGAYVSSGIPADMFTNMRTVLGVGGGARVETEMVVSGGVTPPPVAHSIPVIDVIGIGDVLAERLKVAGIVDVATLARLTPDKLVRLLTEPDGRDFPNARAVEILREARALLNVN